MNRKKSNKDKIILGIKKPKSIKDYLNYFLYWSSDLTIRYHNGHYFAAFNLFKGDNRTKFCEPYKTLLLALEKAYLDHQVYRASLRL